MVGREVNRVAVEVLQAQRLRDGAACGGGEVGAEGRMEVGCLHAYFIAAGGGEDEHAVGVQESLAYDLVAEAAAEPFYRWVGGVCRADEGLQGVYPGERVIGGVSRAGN